MDIDFDRLGIVAGSGNLPISIVKECEKNNIKPFIVVLKDFAKEVDYNNFPHRILNLGDVGKAISFFKKNKIKHIVFAGGVKKPDLKTIWPDLKGLFLLLKLLKCKIFGDDTILQTTIKFLEKEGFEILPVDQIVKDIKISYGIAGNIKLPDDDYLNDIDLGIKVLKQIGDLDIGQSVIIQNGIVRGIECIEGTAKLIERCGKLKYTTGRKPILVKIKKSKQTRKIDLPAIGEDTVLQAKQAGFAGIAIDADNGLVINREATISVANKNKIFIYGAKI